MNRLVNSCDLYAGGHVEGTGLCLHAIDSERAEKLRIIAVVTQQLMDPTVI